MAVYARETRNQTLAYLVTCWLCEFNTVGVYISEYEALMNQVLCSPCTEEQLEMYEYATLDEIPF